MAGAPRDPRASWLMVLATLFFAGMGVCVKLAAATYSPGEIVFYRGLVGAIVMALLLHWRGTGFATRVPAMHVTRSIVGVTSLSLWFYALANLPLATAMTLNYMSSIWIGMIFVGGAVLFGRARIDWRFMVALLLGFGGVALVLRPTIDEHQLWYGVIGLLSGMVSAIAFLQITALGRTGEPESRIVFYFSLGGCAAGAAMATLSGWHGHSLRGFLLLMGVGLFASAAQLLMTRAYARGRPLVNASLQYLGIAFSFVFGVALFDDPVTWMALVGMLLIVGAGLLATQLRSGPPVAGSGAAAPPTEY